MGRQPARGLEFAPWDVGVLENSIEIDKLVGAQGAGGFMVYFAICQRAAGKTGYYYAWDQEEPPVLARKLGGGVTAECVEQTIRLCLRIGLFDKGLFDREGILTSRRLQRNFIAGIRRRRRETAVVREYWLLGDEELPGVVFYTKNDFLRTAKPDLRYLKTTFASEKGKERKGEEYPHSPPAKNRGRRRQEETKTVAPDAMERAIRKSMDELNGGMEDA